MKIQSKKKFIAFSLVVILATIFSLTWIKGSNASAATVGQQLTAPESGWKRFDDTDSKIRYIGSWDEDITTQSNYNKTNHWTTVDKNKVIIKFYGTKLRLIHNTYANKPNNLQITIDESIERYSIYEVHPGLAQKLCYEKTNLQLGIHTVTIEYPEALKGKNWGFDAIDIDSDGYLVDASTVAVNELSLNKTSLSLNVSQSEDLIATVKPDNASIKDVTWTSSDESIATVDENGKVTAIKAGNVTITTKTTDGSNLTATCDVTVVQPSNDRAILAITMINGQTKEYDLPNSEIEAFTNWFDSSNGKGQPKFAFTKKIQPYKEVKEYVVFDKISSYEVRTYTVSN